MEPITFNPFTRRLQLGLTLLFVLRQKYVKYVRSLSDVEDLTQLSSHSDSVFFIPNRKTDSASFLRSGISMRTSQHGYTHDLSIHQTLLFRN